jgi:isopentenyl-diphosphate delta-isomerase
VKEEPVDILDEQGNKTGQVLLKSEAHKQGLWHGGAHIWIYNSKGEVLMQLRSPKKIVRPNIWDVSVAGHIAAGKTPLKTLVEEAEEELGLKIKTEDLELLGNGTIDDIMDGGKWHHRVYLWIYASKNDDLNLADLKLEEAETAEVRWTLIKQLREDLNNPAMANQYSPTPISYEMAITEIPKRLGNSHSKRT